MKKSRTILIKIDKPDPKPEEIQRYKNFNRFVNQFYQIHTPAGFRWMLKTNIKKQQLSNSKAHLYRQILVSLKLNPMHQNAKMQVREQLDFATILYNKGLHKQSLKVLDKAKGIALTNEDSIQALVLLN